MTKDDVFQLGHISRAHGFKGTLVGVFDTDQPEAYQNLESVFVETHGELIPFFIEKLRRNSKGHFLIDFEDINPDEAQSLIGKELYLPIEVLPPLVGNDFYYHEVIGFHALNQEGDSIGNIQKIIDNSAQDLFVIAHSSGKEILVPIVDEFISELNREKKAITLILPEGLLDLYL